MTNLSDILPPSNVVTDTSTDTLTNKTLTSPKVNEDVAVTSTATELNILDGVTSTTAELNILDGVTSTAAELNILDGVTSTAAELNILDGVTSTAAELNALDGITAVVGELNALDIGSTAVGTAVASKAVILDSNKDYTGVRNLTISGELDAATLDISGDVDVDGTLETDALSINGTTVTSTAAELNILDGVTSTAAELNIVDAVSRGSLIYGNASAATALLTKGSANQVLTSDGTDIAWANAAAGGTDGWELISTITPTAATTISGANIISSSYEAVRIILSNIVTSGTYQDTSGSGAGGGLDMRLATGGSVDSGNNYGAPADNPTSQINGGADFQITNNHHTLSGSWIYPNGDGFNGEILITGLQRGSGINKNIYARTTIEANNTWYKSTYSIGIYNGGTVTGIQFFTEGATATYVATGQVKVYGLKVS